MFSSKYLCLTKDTVEEFEDYKANPNAERLAQTIKIKVRKEKPSTPDYSLNYKLYDLQPANTKEDLLKFNSQCPGQCAACGAFINKFSDVYSRKEYSNLFVKPLTRARRSEHPVSKNGHDMTINDVVKVAQSREHRFWICEFCNHHNKFSATQINKPDTESCYYSLQTEEPRAINKPTKDNGSVILCLDFSSSMGHGIHYTADPENTVWNIFTRLETMKRGVCKQLKKLKVDSPDKKVGIILFDAEVKVYGDGSQEPRILKQIDNFEKLLEDGETLGKTLMNKPIKETFDSLIKILESHQPKGMTALGSALATSLGLIDPTTSGSEIFLWSDGQANLGIGPIEVRLFADSHLFYEKLAYVAKAKRTQIHLVSMRKGVLDDNVLIGLSAKTNGNFYMMDARDVDKDLAQCIHEDVVALDAELSIRLSSSLRFKQVFNENSLSDSNTIFRTTDSHVTPTKRISNGQLYYELQPLNYLQQVVGVDLTRLQHVYCQIVVKYRNKKGQVFQRVQTGCQQVFQSEANVPKQETEKPAETDIRRKLMNLGYMLSNNSMDQAVEQIKEINSFLEGAEKNKKTIGYSILLQELIEIQGAFDKKKKDPTPEPLLSEGATRRVTKPNI